MNPIMRRCRLQQLPLLATALAEAARDYRNGFFQPLERWLVAQRALGILLTISAAWYGAARLGAVVDGLGSEARQQTLAQLQRNVDTAQQQAGRLPVLRDRALALGAGDAPDPVPDTAALLHIVSAAVDQSGVLLTLFEPGQVSQEAVPMANGQNPPRNRSKPGRTAGSGEPDKRDSENREAVEEIALHLKASGTYARIVRFVEALSALSQPVIVLEAHIVRSGDDQEILDAMVRVMGQPEPTHSDAELNDQILSARSAWSDLSDPFAAAGDRAPQAGSGDALSVIATGQLAGSFQLGLRRAVLLRRADGWQLVPLAAHSPLPDVIIGAQRADSTSSARTGRSNARGLQ